ncbi:hypothetical protein PLESTF_000928600 [Pleodorina starrii]|nr:hypothetical protein PLESTM_001888500 [Pleodorina starrii]GLC70133.1 hypothetical protein PLESTF_000928600 [Pleodorina starrii]
MLFGLGNHDITNNHPAGGGSCSYWSWPPANILVCAVAAYGYKTCCSATMLKIQFYDLDHKPYGLKSVADPGAAYSWVRDGYRFLQLNWDPTIDWIVAINVFQQTRLGPYMDWFENQLREAQADRQKVVIYIHHVQEWLTSDARFTRLLRDYPVSLILQGHVHNLFGARYILQGVPVVFSGAAEYLSYLEVGYRSTGIQVSLFVARANAQRKTVASWTYTLGANGKINNTDVGRAFSFDPNNMADHDPIPR